MALVKTVPIRINALVALFGAVAVKDVRIVVFAEIKDAPTFVSFTSCPSLKKPNIIVVVAPIMLPETRRALKQYVWPETIGTI